MDKIPTFDHHVAVMGVIRRKSKEHPSPLEKSKLTKPGQTIELKSAKAFPFTVLYKFIYYFVPSLLLFYSLIL